MESLTWAEIDLDAIAHNIREFKALVGENVMVMAVVKANAYGHGDYQVARAALKSGAERLAVNRAEEGVALRRKGIDETPILLLGHSLPEQAREIVEYRLTPTVTTKRLALTLSKLAGAHPISVHVKVDTGMGRFGILPEEAVDFLSFLKDIPGIEVEGLFTHFAVADLADKSYTRKQFSRFMDVVKALKGKGLLPPVLHVCNSAATMDLPEMHLDMVRIGIAMYGLRPSDEVEPSIPLRPALSLKSRVARVRTIPKGWGISYGLTFVPPAPMKVALVPVGYGDGYHRLMSNRGAVLIRGTRAPIVGRVCMDQFVVDASHIPDVAEGDEVVLIGRQGEEFISAEEVAGWAETINYEVVTSLLPRVARKFLEHGELIAEESIAG